MLNDVSVVIEPYVLDQIQTRRFRWSLTAAGEPTVSCTESFATKREAILAGEIARQRAIERGSIRPITGKRPRYTDPLTHGTAAPTFPPTR